MTRCARPRGRSRTYHESPPRRGGRVVECTGLENRRRGNSSAGSNPAPSASDVVCLLGFSEVAVAKPGTAGDRLRPLKLAQIGGRLAQILAQIVLRSSAE